MRQSLLYLLLGAGSLTFGQVSNNMPNAVRFSKYILTVSDLEKTYAFYHDALAGC